MNNAEFPPTPSNKNKEQHDAAVQEIKESLKNSEEVTLETPEDRAEQISSINEEIERVMAQKPDGSEKLDETPLKPQPLRGDELYKDPRTITEKQNPPEEIKLPEKGSSGFKKALRRWAAAFGFLAATTTAMGATSTETNPSDSTKNKTEQFKYIEANKEVSGLTYKGALSVPSDDKEYDYFFIGLDGNDNDENKIGHMKQAIKELGFEAASTEELRTIFTKNQKNLVEKIGYGMAIDTAHIESDDTKDINVNDGVGVDAIENFTTFNPTGQINRYEHNMMGKDYKYGDYAILVKVKKQKEDTVQMPGADFAQTNK